MARKNRIYGQSGIYHVMLRGVNKQRIFEWKEDYQAFIEILHKTLESPVIGVPEGEPNYRLHAYCLMDNHVHLLIGEIPGRLQLPEIVTRIGTRYARHFNLRYHRVGHLFQDRYRSQPCDNIEYFFRLMDYIHSNPVVAGLCKYPEEYPYSSFRELTDKGQHDSLCSTDINFDVSSDELAQWLGEMKRGEKPKSLTSQLLGKLFPLLQAKHEDLNPYEYEEMIVKTLLSLTDTGSISEFQQLDKKPMREALAIVRDTGVSVKQLSRLTGVSEGIIRYCKNPNNL